MRCLVGKGNTTDPTNENMNTTCTLAHAEEGQRARIRKNTVMIPQQNFCANMSAEHGREHLEESYELDPLVVWKQVDAE